jgi:hypothetical protein
MLMGIFLTTKGVRILFLSLFISFFVSFYNISLFIYLFLAMLGIHWCMGALSEEYSLVAVHRLLIVVVSLVMEHGF